MDPKALIVFGGMEHCLVKHFAYAAVVRSPETFDNGFAKFLVKATLKYYNP